MGESLHHRTDRVLELLDDCSTASSRADLVQIMLPRLQAVFGCDEVSFADVSPSTGRTYAAAGYPTPPEDVPVAIHTLRTRLLEHPWWTGYRGDPTDPARRLSDITSMQELRRTPFFADFYRPRGVTFVDYGALRAAPGRAVVVGLGRRRRDLTDDEHQLFDRARRPLGALWVAAHERERPATIAAAGLTEAETRVAELVSAGLSNAAVAVRLGVSIKAVEQHLTHIYRRLGVRSRVQLVLAVGRSG